MISLVTANIASGIRAATNLAARLATTTLEADSHTIRRIEGVLLRSAFSRSRHLGLGSLAPSPIAVSTEFIACNPRLLPHYDSPFSSEGPATNLQSRRVLGALGTNPTGRKLC